MATEDGAARREASPGRSRDPGSPSPGDAADAEAFVPIAPLRPPAGGPGVRMLSLNGVGYGSSTVCCAPSAAALLARGRTRDAAERGTAGWRFPPAADGGRERDGSVS